jgi:GNAT superfamily N-acetyltransferase
MISTKIAQPEDAQNIVSLFTEENNDYQWNIKKWEHYYKSYTEGTPISIVAEKNNQIIGHYGVLPIQIADYKAMLGLHAYVSKEYRGFEVISKLMSFTYDYCQQDNIDIVCAFANNNMTLIQSKLFKWNHIGNLIFSDNDTFDHRIIKNRPFQFNYSNDWYKWRFGIDTDVYLSEYSGLDHPIIQLLKSNQDYFQAKDFDLSKFQFWDPNQYSTGAETRLYQPFSIKILNSKVSNSILDINHWKIDMGDSDTFVYSPYQTKTRSNNMNPKKERKKESAKYAP